MPQPGLATPESRTEPSSGKESWAMAEYGDKFRFAMGLFDEFPRLDRAMDELINLGLSAESMCLAGLRAALDRGTVLYFSKDATRPALVAMRPALGEDSETALWATDGPVWKALQHKSRADAARSLADDIAVALGAHMRKGAVLVIARGSSAALQDQVVRALLRHSLHPVHSEEMPVHH